MKIDIRRYLALRNSLASEKSQLENRLNEIKQALGNETTSTTAHAPIAPSAKAKATRGRRKRGGTISLRDAVLQATASGPLTKQQILDRVQALGFQFFTKNPMNSLGVILYGKNPKFRNENGRFSPLRGGTAPGAAPQSTPAKAPGRKKRTMSPEARARIAAAQRARWAKAKSGK